MAVKEVVVCDKCGKVIDGLNPGISVHGNIYYIAELKDIEDRKGLVGDNMSDPDEIKTSHYHDGCLVQVLFRNKKLVNASTSRSIGEIIDDENVYPNTKCRNFLQT